MNTKVVTAERPSFFTRPLCQQSATPAKILGWRRFLLLSFCEFSQFGLFDGRGGGGLGGGTSRGGRREAVREIFQETCRKNCGPWSAPLFPCNFLCGML